MSFLFLLRHTPQTSTFTGMVSGESKANVVEMPLHSLQWLGFVLQHMYAQIALCSVFCRRKMYCSKVLSTVAESALRHTDSSVERRGGGGGGEQRETKLLHHFHSYRKDNKESTFQIEKVKCLQTVKEAKKIAKRGLRRTFQKAVLSRP